MSLKVRNGNRMREYLLWMGNVVDAGIKLQD